MQKRGANFELLRIISMMMIVMLHLLGNDHGNVLSKTQEFSAAWVVTWGLIANIFLIRKYGALGAVLGTLIAEAAVTAFELVCTRTTIPFLKFILEYSVYIIPSVCMLISVRWVAGILPLPDLFLIPIMILMGGSVYTLIGLAVSRLNPDSIFLNHN